MGEGLGKCDRNAFKELAESQTCGSRGPLPFRYPFLETRRCDMQYDCPYEEVNSPTYKVDEGEQCMDEYCCRTYEIRGNGKHPFAYDINKLYGVYTRMPKLYHGVSP